jgi:FkbM family methyltransferase
MVHFSTIKYLAKHGGLDKIIKAMIFYLKEKITKSPIIINEKIFVNNHHMFIIPNDLGISRELAIYKIHEPLTTSLINKILKNGMVCLDVGSNIGYYVLLESELVGKEGKVIGIEPSPINFEYLKKNTDISLNKNIEIYNFAAADENKTLDFVIGSKSNWSKVLVENEKVQPGDKLINIQAKQIDAFVREKRYQKIDFVRMDVEGYEYNLLKGLEEVMKIFKPKLLIEVHKMFLGIDKTKEMFERLKQHGYEAKYLIPRIYDVPIIGDPEDIQQVKFDTILADLKNDQLPDSFQLYLEIQET